MALFVPWVPLILLLLLILTIFKNKRRRAFKLPPGPTHLPILGDLHLIDRGLPHRSLWLLSKKHGPLMHLKLGRMPVLIVSSARMANEIFKIHDHAFSCRPTLIANRTLTYDYLDIAFSTRNGDYWKDMKKLLVLELLNPKTVMSFRSIRVAEVERMISFVRTSSPSEPINLKEMLTTLTNNIVCLAAFGKSYLGGYEHTNTKLLELIEEGANFLTRFFVADFLPWMWWIDVISGLHAELKKCSQDLDNLYEQVIDDHLDPKRQKPEREDYLDVLLRVQKDCHLTKDHIKGIMMNILFGATDTVVSVVVWGMLELMRNPRWMKKCQEEVRRTVGKKGKVDEDDLNQLQYLKLVVKETMRLRPPAPLLLPRECGLHCNINGYDILPSTVVIVNTWAIGRDPESWESPDEFLPERFMNSSIDYKGQDFELVPFGAGRRGCPGIQFAIPTIELALASLLYGFDWKMASGTTEDIDITEAPGLISLPKSIPLVPTKHDFASLC